LVYGFYPEGLATGIDVLACSDLFFHHKEKEIPGANRVSSYDIQHI
jgi:hypothetical protein